MRTVSAELQAFLDSHTVGVWAHLITITPRSVVGSPVYWTDHSSALLYGGNTFLRGGEGTTVPTIELGRRIEVAGTEIGSLDVKLGCGAEALFLGVRLPKAAADRMFDGATVKVERVFGEASIDLSLGTMHVFEGLVAEARPTSTVVELDIESGLAALNIEIPRKTFKAGCHNVFGDAQCGIDLASKTVTGTVAGSPTVSVFASTRTEADGYFNLGVLTFGASTATVELRGIQRAVRAYANTSGVFGVDRPLPVAPAVGDTFSVYPGCPKTVTGIGNACENKWGVDNRIHARAFPCVPRKDQPAHADLSASSMLWMDEGTTQKTWQQADAAGTYGRPIPVVYGKARLGGRFIFWGPANRGNVPAQVALCEGPIAGVDTYYSRNYSGSISALPPGGVSITLSDYPTFPASVALGTGTRPTQDAWAPLPSGKNFGYPGVAVISYASALVGGELVPLEWEVRGKLDATGGADDADPALVIHDLMENGGPLADPADGYYGAGFPFLIVTDEGLDEDALAASSYARYVGQESESGKGDQMWISFALTERRQALDVLQAICNSTNSEALWSGGKLKIIPRGDTVVGTFAPCTKVRYAFTERDFATDAGSDPVTVRLEPETETFNLCPVSFQERTPEGAATDLTLAYQSSTAEDPDPVDVALRDERPASEVQAFGVTRRPHALRLSRILAQRQVRTRQEVEFPVQWRFCRLEPLDLVTITDTLFPYSSHPFQIRQIEEDCATGVLTITGQEWTAGVNHATAHATQNSDGATTQWQWRPASTGEITADLTSPGQVGNNLWPNATSEEAPPSSADLTASEYAGRYKADAGAYAGEWVRAITAAPGATETIAHVIPCVPGEVYDFKTYIRRNAGSGWGYPRLEALDKDGAVVTTLAPLPVTAGTWTADAATGFSVPATAVRLRSSLVCVGYLTDTTIWFDGISFRKTRDWDEFSAVPSVYAISASGTRSGAGNVTVTTASVSVTASNTTGSPAYAWERVSGPVMTLSASTSASTTFSGVIGVDVPPDTVKWSSMYRCKVTNGDGLIFYTAPVSVTLTATST